ncbi:MAG: hypothetical protein ABR583_06285 [Gaiellaceae bacterium]
MTDGLERVLAGAGVAFAAVLALAAVLGDRDIDAYLLGLAAFFLVAFLGALRAELRTIEGETAPLSAVAVIGGSAAAALYALLAVSYAGGGGSLEPLAFGASFPQAALVGAASTVMIRTGAVSRSLGLAGQALVPFQLGAPLVLLSSTSEDFAVALALGPFCAWVLAASLLLLREPSDSRSSRPPAT